MKIRTSSCLVSSLSTASFQIVRNRDCRGLVYRVRRDIMSTRQLRQDPFPNGLEMGPRGSMQTTRQINAKKHREKAK